MNQYVPAAAIDYCVHLWEHYQFRLRIAKPRRSRLGDFRVLPFNKTQITVNADLSQHAFLITYIHEVAHAAVHKQTQQQRSVRVKPHGKAWQTTFQQLMQPVLNESVFPESILKPLRQYLIKPAATTAASPALMLALRQSSCLGEANVPTGQVMLRNVAEGKRFRLAKKTFIRGTLRRTRIVCKEISSGRSYAVLAHVWVDVVT